MGPMGREAAALCVVPGGTGNESNQIPAIEVCQGSTDPFVFPLSVSLAQFRRSMTAREKNIAGGYLWTPGRVY